MADATAGGGAGSVRPRPNLRTAAVMAGLFCALSIVVRAAQDDDVGVLVDQAVEGFLLVVAVVCLAAAAIGGRAAVVAGSGTRAASTAAVLILAVVCLVGLVAGPSITTLYVGCALLMAALLWVVVRRDPPRQRSLSRLQRER